MSRCYVFLKARLLFSPTTLDLTCHVFSREMSHRIFACKSSYWSNYFISHRIQVWYLYIYHYIPTYIYHKKSPIHGSVNYTVNSFPWMAIGAHGYPFRHQPPPAWLLLWLHHMLSLGVCEFRNGNGPGSFVFGYDNSHENHEKTRFWMVQIRWVFWIQPCHT